MKLTCFLLACLTSVCLLSGCDGGGEKTMEKDEIKSLNNPQKEMPPQAVEAMKKGGSGAPPSSATTG